MQDTPASRNETARRVVAGGPRASRRTVAGHFFFLPDFFGALGRVAFLFTDFFGADFLRVFASPPAGFFFEALRALWRSAARRTRFTIIQHLCKLYRC